MGLTSTQRVRRFRENNPIRAAYLNLKNNAKRRRKEFLLTFDQFREFAVHYKISYGKKRTQNTWSVDRIDPSKGYSIDNIQLLTLQKNSEKRWADTRVFEYSDDYSFARIKSSCKPVFNDSPF